MLDSIYHMTLEHLKIVPLNKLHCFDPTFILFENTDPC